LLSGARLVEAQSFLEQYDELGMFSALVKEYIEKSIERKKRKRRSVIATVGSVMFLFMGLAILWTLQSRKDEFRLEKTIANYLFDVDLVKALTLAIKATGDNQNLQWLHGRHILPSVPPTLLRDAIVKAKEKNRFDGHKDSVLSVAFSPDGRYIVSGSIDRTVRLWDINGNPIGGPFKGHESQVISVGFCPDGKQIVSGSNDGTIGLWGILGNSIGKHFIEIEPKHFFNLLIFSPNCQYIASINYDQTLRLWDINGNTVSEPFTGHESVFNSRAFSVVNSISFSQKSKRIVSGSDDKTLRLWDLRGNHIGEPFRGHKSAVNSVAFSPNGKHIVSGSDDKTLRLWDINENTINEDLLSMACKRLQFHPVLAVQAPDEIEIEIKIASEAAKTCQNLWDDMEKAKFLVRQGWLLVLQKQDVEGAVANFEEAGRLDPNVDVETLQKSAKQYAQVEKDPSDQPVIGVSGSDDLDIIDMITNYLRHYARQTIPLILRECEVNDVTDPGQIAYILATAEHESRLGQWMASGWAYERRSDLGNTQPGDGGFVWMTERHNYTYWSNRLGIDLVNNPEIATEPSIAAKILVISMRDGLLTGYKLRDFINSNKRDFYNARRIVNHLDRAAHIAAIAEEYYQVLR